MDLVSIATLVGFFGDILLQLLVKYNVGNWGLKDYFKQHGSAESMFVAAGMMAIFYVIYIISGLPLKIGYIAVYGVILDLIFRLTRLFPSLDGYYASLNYVESAIWGIIPMIIPLLIYQYLQKK
jgi:hypothetical protein